MMTFVPVVPAVAALSAGSDRAAPAMPAPYWASNMVPRYRYRRRDDRIDPYGPPVVPVIRYGNQEVALPAWHW